MRINFEANLFSRNKIMKLIDGLTPSQLNAIPKGLNHSIIWNIGHILAMQQVVIYKAAGQTAVIKEALIEKYKTGSIATGDVSETEINYLKENLFGTLEQFRKDYQSGVFETYNAFTTKAGVVVNSIEDAISFHTFHEGIHLGWIMEIKKLVSS